MPKGALNIVSGPGSTVGEAIVTNDDVASITFYGKSESWTWN
ncbi:aldehyde dehydrogenase family protein [Bacillus paranthracis]